MNDRPPFEPVLRLLDQQLSAGEIAELADRLRGDETARRQAAALLLQIGVLGEMAHEPDLARLPRRARPLPERRTGRTLALAAAGALLVAA
ncbi:MAG TPA: hypothetical protein VN914_01180, partial [Polyangia bacterium]|nr:hypothetical protein [Polyangia bacterium]